MYTSVVYAKVAQKVANACSRKMAFVEEKAAVGRRALGAWLNRCKAEVGDVGIGTFKKLMSALVDSTMLYGVEIWGCTRSLEAIEQVQLRAFRTFFGVGTLHPKASLMMEMESSPVVWEARVRCVQFWYKVMTSKVCEGRLLRKVASQAWCVQCYIGPCCVLVPVSTVHSNNDWLIDWYNIKIYYTL